MTASPSFTSIVVGIDRRGACAAAVTRALELAANGARVVPVLGVPVPAPLWPGLTQDDLQRMHAVELAAARQEALKELGDALGDPDVVQRVSDDLRVVAGHPGQAILQEARRVDADLVLLGPHAKRTLFDLGSTLRAVVTRAERPVWTQIGDARPVERLVVPVDFSDHGRAAFLYAAALAEERGLPVHLVHVFVPPAFAYSEEIDGAGPTYTIDAERDHAGERLREWTADLVGRGLTVTHDLIEGDVSGCVRHATGPADLIVMGTHGRTGLSRFLLGSVAHDVLKRSEVPVLTVPFPEGAWLLEDDGAATS